MVIVVTRRHWVIAVILLVLQMTGILLINHRAQIHVPAFLWTTILMWLACTAFVDALILVALADVVFPAKRRPSGTP
jgi:hypothetical protein